MSFFDKAKQAATEMAAKADQAMANAGLAGTTGGMAPSGGREADAALRDYGLLAWREARGHSVDAGERERVVGVLQGLEAAGVLAQLRVNTGTPAAGGSLFGGPTPTAPPPPPGAAAQQGGQTDAPPPPPSSPPPPAQPDGPQSPTQSGGGTAPPPPPPSWA